MQLNILALTATIAGLFAQISWADEPLSIPAALLGVWQSKFDKNGIIQCDDAKSQFTGIELEEPNQLVALNGSFSCEVNILQYDKNYSGQENVIGRWWFETTCIANTTNDVVDQKQKNWHEYGYWSVKDIDGLELEITSSDEKHASFWDAPTRPQYLMYYHRCKN